MTLSPDTLAMAMWSVPAGVGAALALGWGGALSPRSLAAAPARNVRYLPIDLLIVLGLSLCGIRALALVLHALGQPLSPDPDHTSAATFAVYMLGGQVFGQLPPVLYLLSRALAQPRGLRELGVVPRRPMWEVKLALLALLAAAPLVLAITSLAVLAGEAMGVPAPESGHDMLKAMNNSHTPLATAALLLSAVVVAPVLEESIFRGFIQTLLLHFTGGRGRWGVAFVGGVLFMLIHLGLPWQVLPGLFVLGLMLGWLYERTGSLLPGLVLHACFNAANSALAILGKQ